MCSTTREASAALIAALSVFALSGCIAVEPIIGPTPTIALRTATSTPTPEPTVAAPVPTSVVISAASITVLDETSTVIIDIPFTTNGTTAGNQLAEALGATAEVRSYDGDICYPAGSSFIWDNLVILTSGSAEIAAGQVFEVQATGARTNGAIAVYGPHSLQVGASLAAVNAAVPGAVSEFVEEGLGSVGLEAYSDARGYLVGARGAIFEGALHSITSPITIIPTC